MKFIDEAEIEVTAGHGGAGAVHFHREKFVPFGGPDGGNGGNGGSVLVYADPNKQTLLDFRYRRHWEAPAGAPGQGSLKDGRAGADLKMPVPVGTQILAADTQEIIADLTTAHQDFVLARGGRGGKGNAFFKSATHQTPRFAQPGEAGESRRILLSLKLLADVGLIGFPNAGKSTLISRISAARPKIADYPFTTLTPNLGVVESPGGLSFVVADIPGLIPGAHVGKGLGIDFLKHIERTRLLLHLIDPLQLDESGQPLAAAAAYAAINHELSSFSPALGERPQLVLITKADAAAAETIAAAQEYFTAQGCECLTISSVSGQGIPELLQVLGRKLPELQPNAPIAAPPQPVV